MPDQAAGLRSLFARRRPSLLIVAGSDAAKAAVAVHFARDAAAGHRATVLIDGTPGQVATACDLACRYELSHVLAGDMPLADVARSLTPHLLLLPAARALSRFGAFDADEEARLADAFSTGIASAFAAAGTAGEPVDLIVVNAEEGQATRAVEAFGRDARVVIVASDHAPSLRGAYLEMKALSQRQSLENFEIVVPRVDDAPGGLAFHNLAAAARRFLDIELVDGGAVSLDDRSADLAPPPLRAAGLDARAAPPACEGPTAGPAPFHAPSNAEVTHAAAVA